MKHQERQIRDLANRTAKMLETFPQILFKAEAPHCFGGLYLLDFFVGDSYALYVNNDATKTFLVHISEINKEYFLTQVEAYDKLYKFHKKRSKNFLEWKQKAETEQPK